MFQPDEKTQWNFLLGEWLTHCLAHGYNREARIYTMHSRRLHMIYRFEKHESVHLIQITDCHIHNDRERLLSGVNTYDSLTQVMDGINSCTKPADMALMTGDLTHEGDERAYNYYSNSSIVCLCLFSGCPAIMITCCSDEQHSQPRTLAYQTNYFAALANFLLDSHVEDEVAGTGFPK
jgi:hypothetical protein